MVRRTVVAVTGASGAIISQKLLQELEGETHLVMSVQGEKIADHELADEVGGASGSNRLKDLAGRTYSNDDLAAPIASGSYSFDAMVIVPCSTSTLSKIAVGIGDNLITRAALVCLKERRRLVIVPRESPVATVHLENMARLSHDGVVVLPPMLCFYSRPTSLEDVVDMTVGRILDVLGQQNDLSPRWEGFQLADGP